MKKLDKGEIDLVKKLAASDFYIYINDLSSGRRISFTHFLMCQDGLLNLVCRLDCPPSVSDFNVWSGFGAKRTNAPEPNSLQLMKDFLMDVWAGGNLKTYNYIVSWFSNLITSYGINEVALVLVSVEGAGKGFFLTFMRHLLRSNNVEELVGISKLVQKHNTCLMNKRLVVVNECSSTSNEFRSSWDKMKSLITDPYVSIEPKNINSFKIDNISNFLLFSNHYDSILIAQHDRRYSVHEASAIHKNDTKYFDNLASQCFNTATYDAFFTYLLDFDCVNLREIPQSQLRIEMQEISMATPLKYLKSVVEEGYLFDLMKPVIPGQVEPEVGVPEIQIQILEILAAVFYQRYVVWCGENGEPKPYNASRFGLCLKEKIEKKRSNKGMVYKVAVQVHTSAE